MPRRCTSTRTHEYPEGCRVHSRVVAGGRANAAPGSGRQDGLPLEDQPRNPHLEGVPDLRIIEDRDAEGVRLGQV